MMTGILSQKPLVYAENNLALKLGEGKYRYLRYVKSISFMSLAESISNWGIDSPKDLQSIGKELAEIGGSKLGSGLYVLAINKVIKEVAQKSRLLSGAPLVGMLCSLGVNELIYQMDKPSDQDAVADTIAFYRYRELYGGHVEHDEKTGYSKLYAENNNVDEKTMTDRINNIKTDLVKKGVIKVK